MKSSDRICVIGGGRIGLPISVRLSGIGCHVDILDLDEQKISKINSGKSPFFEEGMQEKLEICVGEGRLNATSNQDVISKCNIIISAIGTGINEDGTPNVDSLNALTEMLCDRLNPGDIVILKTTVPIGTTERIANILSEKSSLKLEEELLVAFCPERIVEGRAMHELEVLPKIVGGIGENSTIRAQEVMGLLGGEVVTVANSRTSEMCKLLDNAYRITRFGFAADVASVAEKTGIDAFEAIRSSNYDYPRNNIPLPSIGVSGYCLTKDPYYLDSSAHNSWENRGFPSTWIAARKAADMQTVEAITRIENEFGNALPESVIVVAGVTYKENVDDTRLSHGREIVSKLKEKCREVRIWDPWSADESVEEIDVKRDSTVLIGSDCVIITVPHNEFIEWSEDLQNLEEMTTKFIFDGWGIFSNHVNSDEFKLLGTGIGNYEEL